MSYFHHLLLANAGERLGWTLLHSLWQFTTIGILLWGVLLFLRRRSASLRYLVSSGALLVMLVAGMITFAFQNVPPETNRSAASSSSASRLPQVAEVLPRAKPVTQIPIPVIESPTKISEDRTETQPRLESPAISPSFYDSLTENLEPWLPWISTMWLIGVAVLSLWNFGGWIGVLRLRQARNLPVAQEIAERARRLINRMKINRPVQILQSTLVEVPLVVGWLKPMILLPLGILGELSPEQLEAIIAHELAHIRRHDYLVNLVQTTLETLFFYHPAVWWVSRRIRMEREHCCDDTAVKVCGSGIELGEALTLLAAARLHFQPAMAASGGSLVARVRRVLTPQPEGPDRHYAWLGGLLLLGIMLVGAIAIHSTASESSSQVEIAFWSAIVTENTALEVAEQKTFSPEVLEHGLKTAGNHLLQVLRQADKNPAGVIPLENIRWNMQNLSIADSKILNVPESGPDRRTYNYSVGCGAACRTFTGKESAKIEINGGSISVSLSITGPNLNQNFHVRQNKLPKLAERLPAGHALVLFVPMEGEAKEKYYTLLVMQAVSLPRDNIEEVHAALNIKRWIAGGPDAVLAAIRAAKQWEARTGTMKEPSPTAAMQYASTDGLKINVVAVGQPDHWAYHWWTAEGVPLIGEPRWQEFAAKAVLAVVLEVEKPTGHMDYDLRMPDGLGEVNRGLTSCKNSSGKYFEIVYIWGNNAEANRKIRERLKSNMRIDVAVRHGVGDWTEIATIREGQEIEADKGRFELKEVRETVKKSSDFPGVTLINCNYDYDPAFEVTIAAVDAKGNRTYLENSGSTGEKPIRYDRHFYVHIQADKADIDHFVILKRPRVEHVFEKIAAYPQVLPDPAITPDEVKSSQKDEHAEKQKDNPEDAKNDGGKSEKTINSGDQATAARNYVELLSQPNPSLKDCRQAIRDLEGSTDWHSLAKIFEITATVMQTNITAKPESFTRPMPPASPDARESGPMIEVQTNLDGDWQKSKGTAESWLDWIKRKQQDLKKERFDVLYKLASLYRDRLDEPKQAVKALRDSLAEVSFFTLPIEKLIANEWPLKERDMQREIELGIHRPAAIDLAALLEKLGDLDAAIDMQNRLVLADYSIASVPHKEIEKLYSLLQVYLNRTSLPPVAALNLLSPETPSIEFDLDKLAGTKMEHKLSQLLIAAKPGFALESLEVSADMESKGGYLAVDCQYLHEGSMASLGSVPWYKDQRKGREVRTASFKVPESVSVVYFAKSWFPDTDPDGIQIHRVTVKGTFRTMPAAATGIKPQGGEKLDLDREKNLRWGEPVGGLRAAIAIRAVPGELKPDNRQELYLVVQNVSDAPIHFNDATAATTLRELYIKLDGKIGTGIVDKDPTQTDVVLQPREAAFLLIFTPDAKKSDRRTPGSVLAEDAMKDLHQTLFAKMQIEKAPAGIWSGKLVTGEVSGAAAAGKPQPKGKEAQSLFNKWLEDTRLNGKIPGGALGSLARVAENFVKFNPTDERAPKLGELLKRIDTSHDWTQEEAVALLNEVTAIYPSLPEWAVDEFRFSDTPMGAVQTGQPLPANLENAPWGQPSPEGLRMAWLLEPRAEEYRLGTPLKSRILFHNAGKNTVVFPVLVWYQSGAHKAHDAKDAEIKIDSTSWTTIPIIFACRLAPGEFKEVSAAGIGVGARGDPEDWQNTRTGSWIEAKEGDEVTFTPAPLVITGKRNDPRSDAQSDWWLGFIKDRLSLDKPLPEDEGERKHLLDHVVRDLFGTAPTPEEIALFVTDRYAEALDSLAKRLAQRAGVSPFTGTLQSGATKFRVLAADPDAAKRPRTAKNPGHYTLRKGVVLAVSRRPDGERLVNEASIQFSYDDPVFPATYEPYQLKLPDGYDTWAAAWVRGETVLWLKDKSGIRSYNFSNPTKVKEEVIETDKVPTEILKALQEALPMPLPPASINR